MTYCSCRFCGFPFYDVHVNVIQDKDKDILVSSQHGRILTLLQLLNIADAGGGVNRKYQDRYRRIEGGEKDVGRFRDLSL